MNKTNSVYGIALYGLFLIVTVTSVWFTVNSQPILTLDKTELVASQDDAGEAGEHFLVEYTIDGQRYVRTLYMPIVKQVEEIADEYGINRGHMVAMCILEASIPDPDGNYYACNPEANGDAGKSFGIFQLNLGVHKSIPVDDAKNVVYASKWTANRLLRHDYKEYPKYAIKRHNGWGPMADRYVDKVWQIAKTIKIIDNNL